MQAPQDSHREQNMIKNDQTQGNKPPEVKQRSKDWIPNGADVKTIDTESNQSENEQVVTTESLG